MRAIDEVREMIGGMDPARGSQLPDVERRERGLQRILASARPRGDFRGGRRQLLLVAGAAVVTVAVVTGIAVAVTGESEPAYAATPPLLHYQSQATTEPAGSRLRQLAEVAAAAPAPARPEGTVEHLRSINWFLNSATSHGQVVSAVIPQEWRSWRTDDDAGRRIVRSLPPAFTSDPGRTTWVTGDQGGGGREEVTEFAPGKFRDGWRGAVPTEEAALRRWLVAPGVERDPVQYLQDVAELAGVRLLGPAQRAAVLRLLADLPGMTITGTVIDRAGRAGEAFSMTSDRHGLPTQYTVIIDPATGGILGYEEVLTTTAGMLNIQIPAVISCRSYLAAEYASMPR